MPADVGGEPEPVEADRDEFERGAPRHQPAELAAVAGKRQRQRWRRAGCGGTMVIWFINEFLAVLET